MKILLLSLLCATAMGHGRLIKPMTRVGHTNYENDPVTLDSNEWVCRHSEQKGGFLPTELEVGSTTSIQWKLTAKHVGDCEVFISYDVDSPRENMRWFKIANYYDCRANSGEDMPLKLPSWLKSGRAVMRWGWYALHQHPSVEFYSQCAEVDFTAGQNALPQDLVTFPVTDLYPLNGNEGVGYRYPFGGSSGPNYITGPACALGMTDNSCDLTKAGTPGFLSVNGNDIVTTGPVDDTTTTAPPTRVYVDTTAPPTRVYDDTTAPPTKTYTTHAPTDDCPSGVFVSLVDHVQSSWCQDTCSWNMNYCDPQICKCEDGEGPIDCNETQERLEKCHSELEEAKSPKANYALHQPESSYTSDSWQFTKVLEQMGHLIPQDFELGLGELDGFTQYVMKDTSSGKLYGTCVFHDDFNKAVCPVGAICGNQDHNENGWPGAVASRLSQAFKRNDFRHEHCPSTRQTCTFWGNWWKETFVTKLDVSKEHAEQIAENICVSPSNELLFVARDGMKPTCVGYSEAHDETCPDNRDFICSGSYSGMLTYGWPGQIMKMLAMAINHGDAGMTDYYHPQCGALQNRA